MWHVVIALISIDEQYDHSSCIEYLIIPHLIPRHIRHNDIYHCNRTLMLESY